MADGKIRSALPNTRPVFSHLEAEWLMGVLLRSGHERAEYLVGKLVDGADENARPTYERLRDRVAKEVSFEQRDEGGAG